jgi:peptidyl-prolyl cis-trans isomerase SurA
MTKPLFSSSCRDVRALLLGLAVLLGGVSGGSAQAQQAQPAPQPLQVQAQSLAQRAVMPRTADYIVAVVNSEPITNHEVNARRERIEAQLARDGALPEPNAVLRQVLDRLILERAQLQLARSLKIQSDEAAVDQAVAGVARQNQLSVEELKARLIAEGLDYATFRSNLRDELTLVRLREREVDARVRVSEAEIDQFLRERNAANSNAPLLINLAQILVAVPENAAPEQVAQLQAKAQAALARVRAGEPFAKVAAEVSDAPDRAAGGELGLRPVERLPSLFVDATAQLAPGGLAGPVRSGAGFHVLLVIEKGRANAAMTTVQTRARHILLRPSPQLSEQAIRERLSDMRRRIQAGQADFAELARTTSQDGSAAAGGDLGWASPGMFVPEFEDAMNALAPGQISQPLVSRFGVHLIQVLARREVPLTEREQREVARNALQERKAEEALTQWLQDVRGQAYVEMREPPR